MKLLLVLNACRGAKIAAKCLDDAFPAHIAVPDGSPCCTCDLRSSKELTMLSCPNTRSHLESFTVTNRQSKVARRLVLGLCARSRLEPHLDALGRRTLLNVGHLGENLRNSQGKTTIF
jgi:hypothetical protein